MGVVATAIALCLNMCFKDRAQKSAGPSRRSRAPKPHLGAGTGGTNALRCAIATTKRKGEGQVANVLGGTARGHATFRAVDSHHLENPPPASTVHRE